MFKNTKIKEIKKAMAGQTTYWLILCYKSYNKNISNLVFYLLKQEIFKRTGQFI